jgi:hypothetical protein
MRALARWMLWIGLAPALLMVGSLLVSWFRRAF